MKKYIRPILITICYSIAIILNAYLLDAKLTSTLSFFLSAIFAVFLEQFLEILILELPLHSGHLRGYIDDKAKFEGTWIFSLQDFPHRPYSVVTLGYRESEDTVYINGNGCCDTGEIASKWTSAYVIADAAKSVIYYVYEGRTIDGTDNILKGFGYMNFDKNEDGTMTRGNGFFVDTGQKFSKCNYLFDRVDKMEMKALIHKETLKGNEDISNLIKAYIKKHAAPIKKQLSTLKED